MVLNDRAVQLAHSTSPSSFRLLILVLVVLLQKLRISSPHLRIAGQWFPQQFFLELEVYFIDLLCHRLLLLTADFDSGRRINVTQTVAVGSHESVDIIVGERHNIAVCFGVELHLIVEG